MKIGSMNNGINTTGGFSTEAQIRSTEVKAVNQVKSREQSDSVAKSQTENLKDQEIMNDEMLTKAISQANKALEPRGRRIERAVHEVTHTVMYTIKDTKTDEVIAEFPPKKIQDMIAKMWELAGLFVDEQA